MNNQLHPATQSTDKHSPGKNHSFFQPELISKHRLFLLGLLTVSVILFHQHTIEGYPWIFFQQYGHLGVDGFFFISGMGIAYSLSKKPRLIDFYHKRISRIAPPWLICSSTALGIMVLKGMDLDSTLFKNSFLFPWYLPITLIFYVISPFLIVALRKLRFILLIILITVSCFFSYYIQRTDSISLNPLGIPRFPIYLYGLYIFCGAYDNERLCIKRLVQFATPFSLIFFVVWPPYIWTQWSFLMKLAFISVFPGLPVLLLIWAHLGNRIELSGIYRSLHFLGSYSLEIYLCHIVVFTFINLREFLHTPSYVTFAIELLLSLLCAIVCRKLTQLPMTITGMLKR